MRLTEKQQAILNMIRRRLEAVGECPSANEICLELQVAHQTVSNSLTILCKAKALIRVAPHVYGVPDLPLPTRRRYSKLGVENTTKPRARKCLTCGGKFESEWSGNRICKPCKGTSTWVSSHGNDYSAPGVRFG